MKNRRCETSRQDRNKELVHGRDAGGQLRNPLIVEHHAYDAGAENYLGKVGPLPWRKRARKTAGHGIPENILVAENLTQKE